MRSSNGLIHAGDDDELTGDGPAAVGVEERLEVAGQSGTYVLLDFFPVRLTEQWSLPASKSRSPVTGLLPGRAVPERSQAHVSRIPTALGLDNRVRIALRVHRSGLT
jgi:hypothetical protein